MLVGGKTVRFEGFCLHYSSVLSSVLRTLWRPDYAWLSGWEGNEKVSVLLNTNSDNTSHPLSPSPTHTTAIAPPTNTVGELLKCHEGKWTYLSRKLCQLLTNGFSAPNSSFLPAL